MSSEILKSVSRQYFEKKMYLDFRLKTYPLNQILIKQGDFLNKLYFLNKGVFEVSIRTTLINLEKIILKLKNPSHDNNPEKYKKHKKKLNNSDDSLNDFYNDKDNEKEQELNENSLIRKIGINSKSNINNNGTNVFKKFFFHFF